MRSPSRRRTPGALVLAVLVALVPLVLVGLVAAPAQAAEGRVRGTILGPGQGSPKVTVSWFTADWDYLGARTAKGGGYSLLLAPGTYHLQFTDKRPAYDTDKYAPADVEVTVADGATTIKNVKMHTGASVGGTVRTKSGPAAGARVVAANKARNSFETTADKQGNFALGGLPPGDYSVFTYDKRGDWVGKSAYVPKLKGGKFKRLDVRLGVKAGRFVVDLYAGSAPYPGTAFVTAVSKKNGQFWTEKVSYGTVTFKGLYPGSYELVVPGAGDFLGGTIAVQGKVKRGKTAFGTARLTQVGGAVSGSVVDASAPGRPLSPVLVTVYDAGGTELARGTSAADGTFRVGGPLPTSTGLTVVAGPGGPNPPYLQSTNYCRFGTVTLPNVSVTAGGTTPLGQLALPRLDATCV